MKGRRSSLLAGGLVVAVLVVFGATMEGVIASMDLYLRKLPIQPPGGRQVSSIPRETENWVAVGPDRVMSSEIVEVLGTQNYLSRDYREKNPPEGRDPYQIELHLAYYTGMIDTVPHVPERCFVGAGLQIGTSPRVVQIPLSMSGLLEDTSVPDRLRGEILTQRLPNRWSNAPGVRVRLPRGVMNTEMLVSEFTQQNGLSLWSGYFFVANGGLTPRAEGVRVLAFNLEQDYAYYLKVQFTMFGAESAEELAEVSGRLLDDLYGEIMRCVPDWVEVEAGRYPLPQAGTEAPGVG